MCRSKLRVLVLLVFAAVVVACGNDNFSGDSDATTGTETSIAQCQDGVDNNEDGATDCDDEGCAQYLFCKGAKEDSEELCQDEEDNDGDEMTDCDDPGCWQTEGCKGQENNPDACQDKQDNDGDELVDCRDPDCKGFAFCSGAVEDTAVLCQDKADNDGDGEIDCLDDDCKVFVFCAAQTESLPDACRDGEDNDNDGDTDCEDSGCDGYVFCLPALEDTVAECTDGVDNDEDGDKDCADSDCTAYSFCSPVGSAEDGLAQCRDGIDNDGDELTDCEERDCWVWYFCGRYQGYPIVDTYGATWDSDNRAKLSWADAKAACLGRSGRLPTATELVRNNFGSGSGSLGPSSAFLWTELPCTAENQRVVVRVDDGAIETREAVSTQTYRCIWPLENKDDGYGPADCFGGVAESRCFDVDDRHHIDVADRASLDYVSASAECRFSGGGLALLSDFNLAIGAGLPGGSNNWVRSGDVVFWGGDNPVSPVLKWVGGGSDDWAWIKDTSAQLKGFGERLPFRCVGLSAPDKVTLSEGCVDNCVDVAGRSSFVIDGVDRPVADLAAAFELCDDVGALLPSFSDLSEALHIGLPGGSQQWIWTSWPLFRPDGNKLYLTAKWTDIATQYWYPRWDQTVSAGASTDLRPFRCVWKTHLAAWPECGAGKVLQWKSGALSCEKGGAGSSKENAQTEVIDKWRNAWDGVIREAASFQQAETLCGAALGRLPTATELFMVRANHDYAIADGFDMEWLWSSTPTSKKDYRVIVRLSDGETGEAPLAEAKQYRCMWPAVRSDVFQGINCYGPPGSECHVAGQGIRADRFDRPSVDYVAAVNECAAVHATLPDSAQLTRLIHGKLPGGSDALIWVTDPRANAGDGNLGHGLVKWQGVGLETWSWAPTTGGMSVASAKHPFRCVFDPVVH